MSTFRNALLATAAAFVFGTASAAWASPLTIDPAAYNTGNGSATNSSGGDFALDSGQGPFNVTGGAGAEYQFVNIAASSGTTTYSADFVINITNFAGAADGLCASGSTSCSGWQLFALVSLTGGGSWSGTTFTASSADETIQVYGVNSSGNAGGQTQGLGGSHANYTLQNPSNSGGTGANTLTPGTSITYDSLTGHAPSGGTVPNYNVSGTIGSINPNNGVASASQLACWDGTNPSNSPTTTNCILLADGSSTSGDELIINTSSETETLSLVSSLDPEAYAEGLDGLFGSDGDMTLTIDSGSTSGSSTPIAISGLLNDLEPGSGGSTSNEPVNWDLDPASVPEPASLSLFGMALVGLGAIRRRRRKG